jgi:hypothetical protein
MPRWFFLLMPFLLLGPSATPAQTFKLAPALAADIELVGDHPGASLLGVVR